MRGYVDTRWGQVHYRTAGQDGPTVLLYHESPLSSVVYDDALTHLSRSVRAFAFDTPGYGESASPPHETEIPEYASTLLEAADRLGLKRFAVAGSHTGASLALQVALQAGADRATHVIMSGVPLISEQARAEFLATWAPVVVPDEAGSHFRWAWERYERIWAGATSLVHLGATVLLSNLERYNWAYNAAFRYDPGPDLRRLELPTLFLTAENDLLIASDKQAVEIVRGARIEVVPDLQGQLPLRAPKRFADEVIAFVSDGEHA